MSDYTIGEPDMTPDPITGLVSFEQVVAYSAWLNKKVADLPDYDPTLAPLGVPHFVRDGLRFFSILARRLLAEYSRHSATIDPYLSAALTAAIHNFLTFLPELISLDQPGPN
jgi:hypothetical protein